MVSDLLLLLHSEHRELLVLADRCGRSHRGMASPEGELRRHLRAHLAAGSETLYPVLATSPRAAEQLTAAVAPVHAELDLADSAQALARAARALVLAEIEFVLPSLADCTVEDRRRLGKAYRIKRAARMRSTPPATSRRQRSQTELYEVARRAGIPHRSRMTQAELEAAVSCWEHQQTASGAAGPQRAAALVDESHTVAELTLEMSAPDLITSSTRPEGGVRDTERDHRAHRP